MAQKQERLLADFELRMRQLMFLCDSLKEQNAALQKEVQSKSSTTDALNTQVQQLKQQYDSLKFAKALSSRGNEDEVQKAKQRLSKLVKDVDKCIALLKM